MVPRQTLMKCQCLEICGWHRVHIVEVGVIDARARTIWRRALIEGLASGLLAISLNPLNDQIRLGQQTKIIWEPLGHIVDGSPRCSEIRDSALFGIGVA